MPLDKANDGVPVARRGGQTKQSLQKSIRTPGCVADFPAETQRFAIGKAKDLDIAAFGHQRCHRPCCIFSRQERDTPLVDAFRFDLCKRVLGHQFAEVVQGADEDRLLEAAFNMQRLPGGGENLARPGCARSGENQGSVGEKGVRGRRTRGRERLLKLRLARAVGPPEVDIAEEDSVLHASNGVVAVQPVLRKPAAMPLIEM